MTDIILGLCMIASALVPITATYALVNAARDFRTQEAAALISAALVVFNVIAFAFYRRVFVWPMRPGAARETAREFEEASFALLSTKGTTRWNPAAPQKGVCRVRAGDTAGDDYPAYPERTGSLRQMIAFIQAADCASDCRAIRAI